MSMITTAVLFIVLVGAVVWVVALVDLVRATEMDVVARVILAAALIVVPPLGMVAWLVVRAGRMGVLIAVAGAALMVAVVAGIVAATSPHGIIQSVQVQRGMSVGGSGSAPAP
jgi:hypothetical protein